VIAPWTTWDTVALNLFNLPEEANTFLVWQAFNGEGRIFSIDLFEDNSGKRTRRGKVRFRFVEL
jgi:RNA-dependent RNA polymerase